MLRKIGYIKSIDFDRLQKDLLAMSDEDRLNKFWRNQEQGNCKDFSHTIEPIGVTSKGSWHSNLTELLTHMNHYGYASDEYKNWLPTEIGYIKSAVKHSEEIGGKIEVLGYNDKYVAIKYSTCNATIIPIEYAEWEEAKNYDNISAAQINCLLTGKEYDLNSDVALLNNSTYSEVNQRYEESAQALQKANEEAKKRLEEFRAEMRRKEQELQEQLELQLSKFRQMESELKDRCFMLQLDIFALRSYFGETFSITELSSGKSSIGPLVINQKFRFLDEEFALLGASKHWCGNNKHTVEIFKDPVIQQQFVPLEKCITFFKTSKDNKYLSYNHSVDGLEELEYYHGNQLGMLIRNGDNIYLSFIDEEITLNDNVFMSATASAESKDETIEVGKTKLRDKQARPTINRILLFHILNGLFQNTEIFPELKDVNIFNEDSTKDKIIFSSADKQISGSRYLDLKSIYEKNRHKELHEGDLILILQNHVGSQYSSLWKVEEHRSVGYENRARFADISSGLNRISLIQKRYKFYKLLKDQKPYKTYPDGSVEYFRREVNETDDWDEKVPAHKIYVSCDSGLDDWERKDAWGNLPSRKNNVNLRVYSDEFVCVEYIHSGYIQSWIEQKNIGEWGEMNYVYLVKVLKELLVMQKGREEKELAVFRSIDPTFEYDLDTLDKVYEWKEKNFVRNITPFQAKRILKYLGKIK